MAGKSSSRVEIAGRSWVISRLLAHGCEVAVPVVDSGIDIIAFREIGDGGVRALPLQLKCATNEAFSLDVKYARRGITLIYVWPAMSNPTDFVLSYDEARAVFVPRSPKTASSADGGAYSMSTVSKVRKQQLAPYENRWAWLIERIATQPES